MSSDLKVGGTYFLVAFEDETFARPVIESYEFLGKEHRSDGPDVSEPAYVFRIVGSDDQLILTEAQIWQALDVDGLIRRLGDFRDGKIK